MAAFFVIFSLMFNAKAILPTLLFLCLLLVLNSCSEKTEIKEREKPNDQLSLSADIKELVNDTASVNPLIDSLKTEFLFVDSKSQIIILGELAENWRPFTYYLATEELNQSKKLNYKIGEGDALCKFGIYYVRKFSFDSANYFLGQAEVLGQANNFNDIIAQSKSWNAEVLRNSGEIDKCLTLQNEAISFATKADDKKRLAFCNISKGEAYRIQGEFDKAIDCYSQSIAFATPINDLNKITVCYNSLGDVYRVQNNYPKALEYFNRGLAIAKKNKNKTQIAFCLSCIGDIYSTQNDYTKALSQYEEAGKIAREMGLKLQECQSLSSIGMTYYLLDKNEDALYNFDKTIKLAEEIGNKDKMAFAYSIMGDIYSKSGKPEKAIECFNKTIAIATETGNKAQLANTYNQLGDYYFNLKRYGEAKQVAEKGLIYARETQTPEGIKTSANILANVYETQNNASQALKMLRLFITMKDSTRNEENVKKLAAIEYQAKEQGLKAEQLAREETNKALQAQKDEELKRQKTIRYAFTIGFGLVLILVVVVFRNLQQNKKKNRIITAQKKEVEHQKELVDEKNKEITDSITYAKRLQEAILPPIKLVQEVFPESFILYIPKDIIAGDFYWMEHSGDFTFIAAADSTGHGVPGAMVSVVCSNALNRAIKEFKLTEPGLVLDKARELVLETFAKSEGDVKDGMDISLLCINRKKKSITWAGANNPLWYISPGHENELAEIKANKQPIGKVDNPLPFTTHSLPYEPGKIIYLITDGYADQFGGDKGKKFKYKQLEDLILANQNKSLSEQKIVLEETFNVWKKSYEQVDDVTLLGVKI